MGIIFFSYLFLSMPRAGAQNTEKSSLWYESFYIEAGGIIDFPSNVFLDVINPIFGIHGALGYEWQRLRFSLSSGYSQSDGADPLVENIFFIPLTGRVGYTLPVKGSWSAAADIGFGIQFSKTLHYETALDFLAGRRSESLKIEPLIEGRLYATYTLPGNFFRIYAGGGVDIILERKAPIPLPVLDLGISLKPLALFSPKKHKASDPFPKPITEPKEEPEPVVEEPYPELTEEPEPVVEEPYPELTEEPEPVAEEPYLELAEEPEPEPQDTDIGGKKDTRSLLFQRAIYFEPDRGTRVLKQSWPLLQEAGRILQANPEARITLRGYAASFGTEEGQNTISAARVWFCVEYLKWECGIAEDRIHMEFFGAEKEPVSEEAEWQLRRRVELIID
jgi:outer membrane protein OmpA-like peptidoglycan-associated protein